MVCSYQYCNGCTIIWNTTCIYDLTQIVTTGTVQRPSLHLQG